MEPIRLEPSDVQGFIPDMDQDILEIMCADVTALAQSVAPCLRGEVELPDYVADAALAILRGAVIRWAEADSGAIQQQSMGPFSQTIDTSVRKGGLLWPSEIRQLQQLCREAIEASRGKAYGIDTMPQNRGLVHATTCDVWWDPERCSCGAILTQRAPLWGTAW